MNLDQDFDQAMRVALQDKFDVHVAPLMAERSDLGRRLANLEGKDEECVLQIRQAMDRKKTLDGAFSAAVAEGGDTRELLQKLRAAKEEIEELGACLKEIRERAIPALKSRIEGLDRNVSQAIEKFVLEARAPFFEFTQDSLKRLIEINKTWFATWHGMLAEAGLSKLSRPNGHMERLLPPEYFNLELWVEEWK